MRGPRQDPRSLAIWVVERTLSSRRPASLFLDAAGRQLAERDRRLLEEISLGTLRWLRRLDHVIEAASGRKLSRIDARLQTPLRVAAYQLLYLDRVPAHAAVHEAVEEAKLRAHRAAAGFVNAVLRKIAASDGPDDWPVDSEIEWQRLGIMTSHPDFLVRRWIDHFGERRARQLLEVNNLRKPLQLLTFGDRGGREEASERLAREGIVTAPSGLSPLGLTVIEGDPRQTETWRAGLIYLQDAASQAAALVPPPAAGERILDLAAAPGGKSFSLRAFDPRLLQVAADQSLGRLVTLQTNCQRLRLPLPAVLADGRRSPWRAAFDRVVLDLPCSGSGTLRKHPELKWRIDKAELDRLSLQGAELLVMAAALVRAGGLLVVVTCSLEPEENQDLVTRFLARHPGYEPAQVRDRLPEQLAPWWRGRGMWQVLPADEHDGFTVHVLRRHDRRSQRALR